jgi:hypothetical protein
MTEPMDLLAMSDDVLRQAFMNRRSRFLKLTHWTAMSWPLASATRTSSRSPTPAMALVELHHPHQSKHRASNSRCKIPIMSFATRPGQATCVRTEKPGQNAIHEGLQASPLLKMDGAETLVGTIDGSDHALLLYRAASGASRDRTPFGTTSTHTDHCSTAEPDTRALDWTAASTSKYGGEIRTSNTGTLRRSL